MKTFLVLLFILFHGGLFAQSVSEGNSLHGQTRRSKQIYIVVEEMPVFKYGEGRSTKDNFFEYANDSLQLPSNYHGGKVYIQFIVEPDSSVSGARVIRGLNEYPRHRKKIEEKIESMPQWIPGRLRGFPVRVKMTMPVDPQAEK
jgi:protein TonB